MRTPRALSATLGAAALSIAALVPTPTQAGTYDPGTAKAYAPVYNAVTGNWDYHCSYSGWRSGAVVTWKCELVAILNDAVLRRNTGSWTPPPSSKTTATFHKPMILGEGALCTRASALSVDGGDSQLRC